MSAATASAVVIAVVLFAAMVVLTFVVRRRAGGPAAIGRPDAVSADVVSRLLEELRRERAETAYWRSTAERLQRRIDGAEPPG